MSDWIKIFYKYNKRIFQESILTIIKKICEETGILESDEIKTVLSVNLLLKNQSRKFFAHPLSIVVQCYWLKV